MKFLLNANKQHHERHQRSGVLLSSFIASAFFCLFMTSFGCFVYSMRRQNKWEMVDLLFFRNIFMITLEFKGCLSSVGFEALRNVF